MKSEQKTNLILVLLAISLLLNLYNYQLLASQRHLITMMRNENAGRGNLGSQLDSAISDLRNRIDRLATDARWVTFTEIKPHNPGTTREAVKVSLDWTLREVGKTSELYLLLKPYNNDKWERIRATRNEGGVFTAIATLNPALSYQYSFEEVTGTTIKSSESASIPEHIYQPRTILLHPRSSSRMATGWSSFRYELWADSSPLDIYNVRQFRVKYNYTDGRTKVVPATSTESTFDPTRKTALEVEIETNSTISRVVLEAEFVDGHVIEMPLPADLDHMMPIELKLR